ncbi:hypothetical protein HaLaN_19717 [Haematococcus lacustris]|uniref:Uncharacterized protein n=1 Tax=Haematococcus lacustris TaxID=44745 RepID=A0A699ZU45_HAELA|nr:hypothetical protein HaLaN_19717 [Haematococcus lacustris]
MIIRLGSDVEELREEVVKLNQTVASLRHELAIALGGSLPASPLRTAGLSNALECLLHFLADSPVHPEMQLPIVDAISFIWHCKKAGLAGNVLPSKPLKPHHTRADMAHFYGGELMHDDGPIAAHQASNTEAFMLSIPFLVGQARLQGRRVRTRVVGNTYSTVDHASGRNENKNSYTPGLCGGRHVTASHPGPDTPKHAQLSLPGSHGNVMCSHDESNLPHANTWYTVCRQYSCPAATPRVTLASRLAHAIVPSLTRGDFVMPSLRQCKEWGHTTGVYPRRDLRATFASNVAHYHAMKGVFTGFAMGRTTPAMNRALVFHADGSTFNSVSHFPVVLKYEMPTDGSDPFAGIDEDEGDISGIIQFWQSIINELQAAGGWFM